ncbi:MAG TPA: MASE1 domain-containing protein [Gemmatimonadales bacterium]|nr:MASE1 domain-containing protein [Gemmatimonadales bacterium]
MPSILAAPRGRVSSGAAEPQARTIPLESGLLVFALIALFGNEVGALFRYPAIGSAVLFPPYAVLAAALLICSRRDWPWYILVAAAAHFVTHWPQWGLSWVLLADVANIARALTAALLLGWLFRGPPRLDSIGPLLWFVVVAALVAPAVGATLGAANVVLHGASPTYWRPWGAWFLSNALTGLTLLPALLLTFTSVVEGRREELVPGRVIEAVLLAAALTLTCVVAFALSDTGQFHPALPLYAPLPVLIWSALRFGPGGASVALTAVAFAAIWSADRGYGPFLSWSTDDSVLTLQLFVVLTAIPVLCIAAVGSARRNAINLYRTLLASLHDHVAILDSRGMVLETNDSWRRFAEPGEDAFHGTRAGDNYLERCAAAALRGDLVALRVLAGTTGVLARVDRRFETEYDYDHDGRQDHYLLSVEALERSAGGAVVRRANVTGRHQAQVEIEEQRRELSHLARVAVLGQLSGALAHELNQPLASILANAEAARRLLGREPADLEEVGAILDDIVTEDQRAARVIQRLRALLKRGETRLQSVDAGELLSESLELAHAELITRGVTATAVVEPNLPPLVVDRVQLQQVLLNLILNACEAMSGTPEPGRKLVLSVRAEATSDVRISVRDNGTGIPPALVDRLFEPFVTTKPEGLGLGLSISRTIVAAHGGRLWAENNPGGGATVHCLLVSRTSGIEQ